MQFNRRILKAGVLGLVVFLGIGALIWIAVDGESGEEAEVIGEMEEPIILPSDTLPTLTTAEVQDRVQQAIVILHQEDVTEAELDEARTLLEEVGATQIEFADTAALLALRDTMLSVQNTVNSTLDEFGRQRQESQELVDYVRQAFGQVITKVEQVCACPERVAQADSIRIVQQESEQAVVREQEQAEAQAQAVQERCSLQRDHWRTNCAVPWKEGIIVTPIRKSILTVYPRMPVYMDPDRTWIEYIFDRRVEYTSRPPDLVVVCSHDQRDISIGHADCENPGPYLETAARFVSVREGAYRLYPGNSPGSLLGDSTGILLYYENGGDPYWRPSQWAHETHHWISAVPSEFPNVATYPFAKIRYKDSTLGNEDLQQVVQYQAATEYGAIVVDIAIDLCYSEEGGVFARCPKPIGGVCITAEFSVVNGFALIDLSQPIMLQPPYNGEVCPEPPRANWLDEWMELLDQINPYPSVPGGD